MMLTKGQRFRMGGRTFQVESVSPSRAHCVAKERRTVTVEGRKGSRSFTAHRSIAISISPNTDVETVEALKL